MFGIPLREYIPYSGRTDRAIARDMLSMHGIGDTPANRAKLVSGYLARLPHSLNRHDGRVLPGIIELLAVLKGRSDVALGLLTGNMRAGALVKLGHYQLFDHFAFGGFGDQHYDRDDVAREALGVARSHLGAVVAPERMWVIGDTPLDVQCARAIGAKVLAVATGVHTFDQLKETAPDLTLQDLSDYSSFVEMLP